MSKCWSASAVALSFGAACFGLGWYVKPRVVETREIVKVVEVEKASVPAPLPTCIASPVERVLVEREPTPHPTDCVAMRWLP